MAHRYASHVKRWNINFGFRNIDSLLVKDIIEKDTAYVNDNDFMTYVRQLMRDDNHRILPVVNEKKNVLGIISEKDVLNITSTKSNITVKGYISETPAITEY